jgi:hypothetical protein
MIFGEIIHGSREKDKNPAPKAENNHHSVSSNTIPPTGGF